MRNSVNAFIETQIVKYPKQINLGRKSIADSLPALLIKHLLLCVSRLSRPPAELI
jgi:hypothetical protein